MRTPECVELSRATCGGPCTTLGTRPRDSPDEDLLSGTGIDLNSPRFAPAGSRRHSWLQELGDIAIAYLPFCLAIGLTLMHWNGLEQSHATDHELYRGQRTLESQTSAPEWSVEPSHWLTEESFFALRSPIVVCALTTVALTILPTRRIVDRVASEPLDVGIRLHWVPPTAAITARCSGSTASLRPI